MANALVPKNLKVAFTYPEAPFAYSRINPVTNQIELHNGIDFHILQTLANRFNFTYDIISCFKSWGVLVNGTWIGAIGEVVNGQADMAIGTLSVTPLRSQFVDFSFPYVIDPLVFVNIKNNQKISSVSTLTEAFDTDVWLLLLTLILITSLFLKLFNNQFIDAILVSIVSLMKLPIKYNKKSTSKRFFTTTWMLIGLVCSSLYAGNLHSSMTRLVEPEQLSSIDQLVEAAHRDNLRVLLKTQAIEFETVKNKLNFKNHLEKTNLTLYERTKLINSHKNIVYFATKSIIEFIVFRFDDNTFNIPHHSEASLWNDVIAVVYPKGSPLKIPFDRVIKSLLSSGHLIYFTRLALKEERHRQVTSETSDKQTTVLHLDAFIQLFHLIAFLFTFTFVTLTFEIFLFHFNTKSIVYKVWEKIKKLI